MKHNQSFYFRHNEGNVPEFITHTVRLTGSAPCAANIWPNFNGTDGCYLAEATNNWNTTPFWIMKVPKSIVPDHNKIFEPGLVSLLKSMVQKYGINISETRIKVQ